MDDHYLSHYSRHLLLEGIGFEGQKQIQNARVLIVGCGGLGCAAAPYLAAAGIGKLHIADDDLIERSNLPRQLPYRLDDVGQAKVSVLADFLKARAFETQIVAHQEKLVLPRLLELMSDCDIVLDCTDHYLTRYEINRASQATGVPLISASATRFEGQLAVYDPQNVASPCYACLFPKAPQTRSGNCEQLGIFSPLVGMMGALQSSEALKLLLRLGESSVGWLLHYDALRADYQRFRFYPDKNCAVCQERRRHLMA